MRLFSGIYTGQESLVTHGEALNTVADNLANQNTNGFKTQRAEFSDIFVESIGSLFGSPETAGDGVGIIDISTLHSLQGGLEPTDRDLDFAIQGGGFFIVGAADDQSYTRAGNFTVDVDGNLLTRSGEAVLGFTEASPDTLVPLNVANVNVTAAATTQVGIRGNLDAGAALAQAPAAPADFQEIAAASNFSTSLEVFDSLGTRRSLSLHFFKNADLTWDVQVYTDGAEVAGGVAGTPVNLGNLVLNFDANGAIVDPAAATVDIPTTFADGAAAANVTFDFSNFTQIAAGSAVDSLSVDGSTTSNVTGIDINDNGILSARLDNGETFQIGTLALADFVNPETLNRISGTNYKIGNLTSDVDVGSAGTAGRGTIRNGVLETSTVEVTTEFTNIVRYQRGYQAASQIISTVSELLATTIQIV